MIEKMCTLKPQYTADGYQNMKNGRISNLSVCMCIYLSVCLSVCPGGRILGSSNLNWELNYLRVPMHD